MMVLFLGGPWHNERHEVAPNRSSRAARSLPTSYTVLLEGTGEAGAQAGAQATVVPAVPRPREYVTYTRRFAQANGERLPVYVSPDYQGPARA